uniref:Uncharacterized protein n=1 Tax=Phaeomonas parva TaxID=124430 RepID=A0A7S1U4M0_9STRA|mmetsp:Transcript_31311/g.99463  ORF Transcript_31311/g.99463 Transcript_31311/m.99463 type:complete len:785 (+) Transcript_31311:1182-3536(+)
MSKGGTDVPDDASVSSASILAAALAADPLDPRALLLLPPSSVVPWPIEIKGPQQKGRVSIAPAKRRITPKTGLSDWSLSEGERLVRQPGRYYETDAALFTTVGLWRPQMVLGEEVELRNFARACFVFGYGDSGLLADVLAKLNEVNTAALGGPDELAKRGSLNTISFTEEEIERANAGLLDVVCGFEIIDEDCRMIVIEGLAAAAMKKIEEEIPRLAANNPDYRVLSNVDVRFKERMYTSYNADLKKIRLREALPLLADMPDLYNSAKIDMACAIALVQLEEMRRADSMQEAAYLDLFPTAEHLSEVESKYGESVSLVDIHGFMPPGKRENINAATIIFEEIPAATKKREAGRNSETLLPELAKTGESTKTKRRRPDPAMRSAKLPLDSWNPAFEEHRKSYQAPDFIREQKRKVLLARAEVKRRREQREEEAAKAASTLARHGGHPSGNVFTYSVQKYNHVEIQKRVLREKIRKIRNATFTYSMDYQSQSVVLADNSELKPFSRDVDPNKWKTERGFVYPAPREPREYNIHPHRPSNARIDVLKEPWVENELHPRPVARASTPPESAPKGRPQFNTTPCPPQIFGGYHVPKYERDYESKHLGDRNRLPRGRMALDDDPKFFSSVHLVGDKLAKEMEEAEKAQEELWRSKIAVDDLHFHVGNFNIRDRPMQTERRNDILHGKVKNKALRIVRNAKLPSGKKIPFRQAPYSIFTRDQYKDPRDFTLDLRPDDPEHFYGTDPKTGQTLPFVTKIHRDVMKPKSQTIQSKRRIQPLTQSDRVGPKWSR